MRARLEEVTLLVSTQMVHCQVSLLEIWRVSFANELDAVILLTVGWKHAEDDSILYAFAKRWIEKTKSETKDAGRDYRWMYINYANQQQDPFAGYGEANYQRLMEIQKNVDSMGIFSSRGLCRGYFKLL